VESLPPKVYLNNTPILNQGSIGACTIFGASKAIKETVFINEQDNNGAYSNTIDEWAVWAVAKTKGASDIS
jgi:hypothetical protein